VQPPLFSSPGGRRTWRRGNIPLTSILSRGGERKIKEGYIYMPIFEFRCEKCRKTFETLVFGNQAVTCPKCKSKKVKKLMSAFSHSSEGKFTSSAGPGCGTCSATSCGPS
jgi:putative FmdB family regulatory protein